MDDLHFRDRILATWWAGLSPDDQAQIFSGRWDPLPEWVIDSATAAGIPLLVIHSPDHAPRSSFPSGVENFLDHVGLIGPMVPN